MQGAGSERTPTRRDEAKHQTGRLRRRRRRTHPPVTRATRSERIQGLRRQPFAVDAAHGRRRSQPIQQTPVRKPRNPQLRSNLSGHAPGHIPCPLEPQKFFHFVKSYWSVSPSHTQPPSTTRMSSFPLIVQVFQRMSWSGLWRICGESDPASSCRSRNTSEYNNGTKRLRLESLQGGRRRFQSCSTCVPWVPEVDRRLHSTLHRQMHCRRVQWELGLTDSVVPCYQ